MLGISRALKQSAATFNDDRSLEYFLAHATSGIYKLSALFHDTDAPIEPNRLNGPLHGFAGSLELLESFPNSLKTHNGRDRDRDRAD